MLSATPIFPGPRSRISEIVNDNRQICTLPSQLNPYHLVPRGCGGRIDYSHESGAYSAGISRPCYILGCLGIGQEPLPNPRWELSAETLSRMINCMHALGYPCSAVRCTSRLDEKQFEECVGSPGEAGILRGLEPIRRAGVKLPAWQQLKASSCVRCFACPRRPQHYP